MCLLNLTQLWHHLPRDSVRLHGWRAQSHKTAPTSDTRYKSRLSPVLLTKLALNLSSYNLLLRFDNLLGWFTKPRKTSSCIYQITLEDADEHPDEEVHRWGLRGSLGRDSVRWSWVVRQSRGSSNLPAQEFWRSFISSSPPIPRGQWIGPKAPAFSCCLVSLIISPIGSISSPNSHKLLVHSKGAPYEQATPIAQKTLKVVGALFQEPGEKDQIYFLLCHILNQKFWEWGPVVLVLTNSLDPDIH